MSTGTPTPRQRLLEALVAHLAEHGLHDTSLRGMAAAVGSSHRMLAYHFGSRAGVLVAVSEHVEAAQREHLAALAADQSSPPAEVMWRMYEHLADPGLWPHERLFYALYSRALQGDPQARPFLDGVVTAWLAPLEQLFARTGLGPGEAAAEARLALGVARGLLLDLLATQDRDAVDAAMLRFVRRHQTG